MDFGAILSRAWQIIWKHKVLWIFGILASCTSTSSGSGNVNWQADREFQVPPQFAFPQIPDWQVAVIVGVIILIVLLLIVLAIFLGTMGRIGLIRGALQAEQGAKSLSFGDLFSNSLPYFWRVFGLNLLFGLAIALVFIIIAIPGALLSAATLGIGLICFLPLMCILIILAWLASLVLEQANVAIVVEDRGILDGFERAWNIVRTNAGNIIVMGIILLVISLVIGFVIGLPVIFIAAPAVTGVIIGTQQAFTSGAIIAGICLVFYIPVAILLNGILTGYVQTSWALTFLRLTGHPAVTPAEPGPAEPEAVEPETVE